MEALVTVVMPVFNRATIVGRTLESIAAQTYRPLKVVLVDNNSSDDTYAVLDAWRNTHQADDFDIRLVKELKPGGAAARNAGLALVDTEFTMFFDSDDVMRPGHVERAVRFTVAHPDADIVGWDVTLHAIDGGKKRLLFADTNTLFHSVLHGTMATLRYMARTSLIRNAGAWNEALSTFDDIELGVRLLNQKPSPRVYKIPGASTVDVYATEESISGTSYLQRASNIDAALDAIHANLPATDKYIANLYRAIIAGRYRVESRRQVKASNTDSAATLSSRILRKALDTTHSLRHRLLLRLSYTYTTLGLRGAARIFGAWF